MSTEQALLVSNATYLNIGFGSPILGYGWRPKGKLYLTSSKIIFHSGRPGVMHGEIKVEIPISSIKYFKRNIIIPRLMFEQLTVCELKQGTKIYHRFLVRNVSFWINKILEQNHSIEDRTNIVRNYLSLPWITFFILIVLGVLESIFYQAVHQNVYLENALLIFTCLMIITMIAYLILGGKERH